MEVIANALEYFDSRTDVTTVRVKNRFEKPTSGGWRDILINFVFNDDTEMHVCEIQIMHRHLLSVREDMGAHHD